VRELSSGLIAIAGVTICSDWWYTGNTLFVPGATVSDGTFSTTINTGGVSTEVTVVAGIGDTAAGVVICEADHSTIAGVDAGDAAAGLGGRCSASSQDGNFSLSSECPQSTPGCWTPGGSSASPNDNTCFTSANCAKMNFDRWTKLTVISGASADGCGPAGGVQQMPYFARVGNNAHGLDVNASAGFYYREMLAALIDGGHVTYFITTQQGATSFLADARTCYGDDNFLENAKATVASGGEGNLFFSMSSGSSLMFDVVLVNADCPASIVAATPSDRRDGIVPIAPVSDSLAAGAIRKALSRGYDVSGRRQRGG